MTKIGLALIREGRLLLVRRAGDASLILPGGKPENGESDLQALQREIREELSCQLVAASVRFVGDFRDQLVDDPEQSIHIRLYLGEIDGALRPGREIREAIWHPLSDVAEPALAPSLRHRILPALLELEVDSSTGEGREQPRSTVEG